MQQGRYKRQTIAPTTWSPSGARSKRAISLPRLTAELCRLSVCEAVPPRLALRQALVSFAGSTLAVKEDQLTRTGRGKLSAIHITGAVTFAAIAQSWALFVVMAAALIATYVMTGEIRPPRRAWKPRR